MEPLSFEDVFPLDKCDVTGESFELIPGNDQNMSPTNQKTAGSNLERTS